MRVFLDGVERHRVTEADEEGRFIVMLKVDEQGRLMLNEARDAFETVRLHGDVAILVPDGFVPRQRRVPA
ncbi:MAG: hypothetical protein KJ023_00075 [Burkholderiaceae bacterium]|nr:hypothetical protein [Burkholderiaceae bacterium]